MESVPGVYALSPKVHFVHHFLFMFKVVGGDGVQAQDVHMVGRSGDVVECPLVDGAL